MRETDNLHADLEAMRGERDKWQAATELWRKKVVAADRKVAKQAVLIEALRELEKALDLRLKYCGDSHLLSNENEITALENVQAAQTELDKETS